MAGGRDENIIGGMSDTSDPTAEHYRCSNRREVVERLETFEVPVVIRDDDGTTSSRGWVFRGLKTVDHALNPRIERAAQMESEWAALEVLISSEFRARAHMHLPQQSIPPDELSWLALTQHWGVPTRLLDFTHSPFVALYFAIRGSDPEGSAVRIWAIDAAVVNNQFERALGVPVGVPAP
jgi:hypothetical protein